MTKKIYLAGIMSNIHGLNYADFNARAIKYQDKGYDVINPVEFNMGNEEKGWAFMMGVCLEVLESEKPDFIAVGRGWLNSPGARIEVIAAEKYGCQIILEGV